MMLGEGLNYFISTNVSETYGQYSVKSIQEPYWYGMLLAVA